MSPVTTGQKIGAGIFVVLAIAVWIYMNITLAGSPEGRNYYALFSETVKGLAPSSLVCYNGIAVGKVKEISNDFSTNRVRIDMIITEPNVKIFADFKKPNKPGTRAFLVTSFVTGLQYINLSGGVPEEILVKMRTNKDIDLQKYELPEGKEIIAEYSGGIMDKFDQIADKAEQVLSPTNLHSVETFLANLDRLSFNFNQQLFEDQENGVVPKLQKITRNLEEISGAKTQKRLHIILDNLQQVTNPQYLRIKPLLQNAQSQINMVAKSINTLIVDMNKVVNSHGQQEDIAKTVREINGILDDNRRQLKNTIANLEKLSATTNKAIGAFVRRANKTLRTIDYFVQKELSQASMRIKITLQEIDSMLRILKAKPNALLWGSDVRER